MAEYIEREAACSLMPDDYYGWRDKKALQSIPAADVQLVRHGRWIEDSDPGQEIGTAWRCSSCGLTIGMKKVEKDWHHYCLNCGAKMDGGINDGV